MSKAKTNYVHGNITRGSHNTSSVARLYEEVIVKPVMLPQSAEDESASYRLGHALTVPWTATCSRTDRDPSYRGRNKRKSTLGAISCDESALTSAQFPIVQFRFRGIALPMPAICLPHSVSNYETARNTEHVTFDTRIREISRIAECSFNNSAVISFTTKSGRNTIENIKSYLLF